ncbi:acyl-CoA dehydrogenase family protein [Streptomyces spongiae]|uniref:Acyl-CoA dehydrogenase family protein n=1 Tax=Streptomyces spongiae TaxID=565072 RepID=A0A5N8XAK5_9ACTN|nr:acyl-CoA dehydrogenase family protein [Streptomyces spongiae]MPY56499.1 acyl-CoA dehydrogenase family protein [Streptomyces spongiae]
MSFELSAEHLAARERARVLAERLRHRAEEADAATELDPVVREALRASRLVELAVPAGNGKGAVDPVAVTVVREALMGVSAHLDSMFAMQGVGSYALAAAGSPDVRGRWLPRIAALDAIAALALTEPEIGSDLRAVSTRAQERGGALVVSGRKSWITNAGAADCFTVLCREGDGHSLVLIPADTPGLRVEPGPDIIAPHVLGTVDLDDVRVPQDHRIGAAGGAFPLVLATLATFRVSVAGAAVGLAQAALEEAVRHTTSRRQFGTTLDRLGPLPHLLGTSWTEVESARLLTYAAATRAAADPKAALHWSSMAKVAATETAGRVVDRCVQMMGRFGLVAGSTIERLYRNARPMRIYEGGNEVLTAQLAKTLTRPLAPKP